MGWDDIGGNHTSDEIGWDRIRSDGVQRDRMKSDGIGWDGIGRDEMR